MEQGLGESLITSEEAQKIADNLKPVAQMRRLIPLAITGSLLLVVGTLAVMIVLSLNGARTGLEALFPFLDSTAPTNLKL